MLLHPPAQVHLGIFVCFAPSPSRISGEQWEGGTTTEGCGDEGFISRSRDTPPHQGDCVAAP
ncbi:hypothetical protein HC928_22555 [bacterium]|nr:hypothetical protein [bacterium]